MRIAVRAVWAIILFLVLSSGALAAPVGPEDALKVGRSFARIKLGRLPERARALYRAWGEAPSGVRILRDRDGKVLAYIVPLYPEGFLVISPDTDINPIIAYSEKGTFPLDDSPTNTLLYLVKKDMSLRLKALPLMPRSLKERNERLWESLEAGSPGGLTGNGSTWRWGPWLETRWGQFDPYNRFCPLDPETGERTVTGCVATAMAQVIFYWRYPGSLRLSCDDGYVTLSKGIYIYESRSGGSGCSDDDHESLDFPSLEELNGMLSEIDYIDDPWNNEDIPALIFACGISVKTDYRDYGSGGSAAYPDDVTAIKKKFGYQSADFTGYGGLGENDYRALERNMKDGRPAILAISEGEGVGGHAVVADGFEEVEGVDYYHINFGWEGLYDAWYQLPEGLPLGYSAVDAAVLNIFPPVNNPPIVDSFTASPSGGDPPLTVTFTCTGHDPDGEVSRYVWDLGGVTTSTQDGRITHTYLMDGIYRVSCHLLDNGGRESRRARMDITVGRPSSPHALSGALGSKGLFFTTDGDAPWFASYGDICPGGCARSGAIGDGRSSCLETCVTGPGTLSFSWKVSSEKHYDKLTLYVDGEPDGSISGEVNWSSYSVSVGEGRHLVKWCYEKDDLFSEGEDAGWISQVSYGGPIPGDADGDGSLGLDDVLSLSRYLVGLSQSPPGEIPDARCDGAVDILDALTASRKFLGLPVDRWGCTCSP